MISWDDAKVLCRKLAQEHGAEGGAFLDTMMNVGYKEVLTRFGRQAVEQTAISTLTATQRGYQTPPDCNMPKTITLIEGDNRIPLTEEPSQRFWERRKSGAQQGRPETFHYSPRFGVGGGLLELDPIPSKAYKIEMVYEATERDLSRSKYTTGTIGLEGASAVVQLSGTGAEFAPDMIGRYLRATSDNAQRLPYRIKGYIAADKVALENVYHGPTVSGLSYEVFEMFALPEDMHMLPIYYANWHWWDTKGNVVRAAKHQKAYQDGMAAAEAAHSMTVRDATVMDALGGGAGLPILPPGNPSWFPETVID